MLRQKTIREGTVTYVVNPRKALSTRIVNTKKLIPENSHWWRLR